MPASLRTLPPEILLLIISNIEKSGWLLDLALCCRSLYRSTLPYLYSHIKLLFQAHENKIGGLYLKSFTVHILKHPELAALVHDFTMDQSWQDSYISSENTESPGIDEAIQQVVSRFHPSQEDLGVWIGSLKRGDVGPYLALLLSSLPNLESLDLVVPRPSAGYFEYLLHSAAKRKNVFNTHSAFSSLRVITHDYQGPGYGPSAGLLSDYLHMPSLHELSCRKIGSYNDKASEGLATLGPATIPLVHLELREGRLNEPDLANVLRACKGLKSFVYEVGLNAYYHECRTPALGQVLNWIENSVENLWLDHGGDWVLRLDDRDLPPISALSSLKVLKNLRVGMYMFLDILRGGTSWIGPALPASIETLYFSHTTGGVTELTSTLERLLQAKESCTPNLRRISFEADIREEDEALDYSRLDFLAKEADVEIEKIEKERSRGKQCNFNW